MVKMKKRILAYLDSIDRLLAAPPEDTDWQDEIDKHLIQIKFFMHERLVHELVMMLFAVLTFITILYAMTFPTIGMLLLIVSLMVLLVPYIMHYYLLENGVQKMYVQYDTMLENKTLCSKKSI